jgi:hypothetical protein
MGGTYATLHANIAGQLVTAGQLRTTDAGIQLGEYSDAGSTNSTGPKSVAIGYYANANTGSAVGAAGAVSIGYYSNQGVTPGENSVTIGGGTATSTGGIALGKGAQANGSDGMGKGSIVFNADPINIITAAQEGFYVNPVREVASENFDVYDGIALYNSTTKEMRFTHTLDGGEF